jgi:hypothetical protein
MDFLAHRNPADLTTEELSLVAALPLRFMMNQGIPLERFSQLQVESLRMSFGKAIVQP